MKNLASLRQSVALAIPALILGFAVTGSAQENTSGNLILKSTEIKTHSTITALPKAPSAVDAFSLTWIYCYPGAACALEINMTSELSDISPGVDSLRFFATVDGSALDVLPTTNFGVNSTAKAGQMESGTAMWLRKNLSPGWHNVRVTVAVNDTNGDGFVSGYIGDRTLVVRLYTMQ